MAVDIATDPRTPARFDRGTAVLQARELYRFYRAGPDEVLALRGVSLTVSAGGGVGGARAPAAGGGGGGGRAGRGAGGPPPVRGARGGGRAPAGARPPRAGAPLPPGPEG